MKVEELSEGFKFYYKGNEVLRCIHRQPYWPDSEVYIWVLTNIMDPCTSCQGKV